MKVEQTPDQFATAVLPPVPANSFQLESDFRQLRSSPDMLYQYLKVSGGSQQCPWSQVRDFLLVAVAMLMLCVMKLHKMLLACLAYIVLDRLLDMS